LDERLARTPARQLGLAVTGVVGVLLRAQEAGLVPAVRPSLEEIRQQGYWLSDEIIELAARLAGES
jgi:predicted nucleic acid-binding protein